MLILDSEGALKTANEYEQFNYKASRTINSSEKFIGGSISYGASLIMYGLIRIAEELRYISSRIEIKKSNEPT